VLLQLGALDHTATMKNFLLVPQAGGVYLICYLFRCGPNKSHKTGRSTKRKYDHNPQARSSVVRAVNGPCCNLRMWAFGNNTGYYNKSG
jgi:hypothetical protein